MEGQAAAALRDVGDSAAPVAVFDNAGRIAQGRAPGPCHGGSGIVDAFAP